MMSDNSQVSQAPQVLNTQLTAAPSELDFPTDKLLPKQDTQADSFLRKYPQYNGQGVTIAIFDTGVDPGAPGLDVTPEGGKKVIDMYDTTGSGDVDTSQTANLGEDGTITGLSGRKLKIPESWPQCEQYNIGLASIYSFHSKSLLNRCKTSYKEKTWNPQHNQAMQKAVAACEKLGDVKTPDKYNSVEEVLNARLDKEEIEARKQLLEALNKDYSDLGPVADCIVLFDGKTWRACVDTSFSGDLDGLPLMASYREEQQFSTFSTSDNQHFCVNIYNDGTLLEIVADAGSHATHVASIAAAYFPDEPQRNGIAPGARIISFKIGDSRLGSMETGSALVRALNMSIQLKVDLINFSYGEASHIYNQGRVIQILHEAVNKHGIMYISSAGNNGPALSTVGTPGGTCSACIGVGAYVTPQLASAAYAASDPSLTPMSYTWSSRGPCPDGALGVSICAPGGAITSVPTWTLRGCQLMNGTSMSSPNACGAIGLLLSALKQEEVAYSPYSVKRALETSAQLPADNPDPFSQGAGLVQVDRALAYCLEQRHPLLHRVRFVVGTGGDNRGILLREPHETTKQTRVVVFVKPDFLGSNPEPDEQISLDMRLTLVCKHSCVVVPPYLQLNNQERPFPITVDPTVLSAGCHYTEVHAYETSNPNLGPIFKVPITIIVPTRLQRQDERLYHRDVSFMPGQIRRTFIAVPESATFATIKLRNLSAEKPVRFVMHTLQLLTQRWFKDLEYDKMIILQPAASATHVIKVAGGRTMELCMARWWNNVGEAHLDYSIQFHSLKPDCGTKLTMVNGQGAARVCVSNAIRPEDLSPSASLKSIVVPTRPVESKLRALNTVRDALPEGRQIYALELTYKFSVTKITEVTAECPGLSALLYESALESQLWQLYDSNKRHVTSGDAYPSGYSVKLDKGDYTLVLQLRHEKKETLESFTQLPLNVAHKLSSSISLDTYVSLPEATIGGRKFGSRTVSVGSQAVFFVGTVSDEKLPKQAIPGTYLTGELTLSKDESYKSASAIEVCVVVSEVKKNGPKAKTPDTGLSKKDEMSNAVRDLKIDWITKVDSLETGEEIYSELIDVWPEHKPLLMARLNLLVNKAKKEDSAIIEAAERVLDKIDSNELLAYSAMKLDSRPNAAQIKTEMENTRNMYLDASNYLGLALIRQIQQETDDTGDASSTEVKKERVNRVFTDLTTFCKDGKDNKVEEFFRAYYELTARPFKALQLLLWKQENKPSRENEHAICESLEKHGLEYVSCHLKRSTCLRYPSCYRPF